MRKRFHLVVLHKGLWIRTPPRWATFHAIGWSFFFFGGKKKKTLGFFFWRLVAIAIMPGRTLTGPATCCDCNRSPARIRGLTGDIGRLDLVAGQSLPRHPRSRNPQTAALDGVAGSHWADQACPWVVHEAPLDRLCRWGCGRVGYDTASRMM